MKTEAIRAVLEDVSWVKDPSTKYSHGVISAEMLSVARAELADLGEDNARKDEALRYVIALGTGVGQLTHAIAHAEAAITGAPSGAFVTLEQLREIEFCGVDDGWECCPVCLQTEPQCHTDNCWLGNAIAGKRR